MENVNNKSTQKEILLGICELLNTLISRIDTLIKEVSKPKVDNSIKASPADVVRNYMGY